MKTGTINQATILCIFLLATVSGKFFFIQKIFKYDKCHFTCQKSGLSLMNLKTPGDIKALKRYLGSIKKGGFWVGLQYSKGDGGLRWSDNTVISDIDNLQWKSDVPDLFNTSMTMCFKFNLQDKFSLTNCSNRNYCVCQGHEPIADKPFTIYAKALNQGTNGLRYDCVQRMPDPSPFILKAMYLTIIEDCSLYCAADLRCRFFFYTGTHSGMGLCITHGLKVR